MTRRRSLDALLLALVLLLSGVSFSAAQTNSLGGNSLSLPPSCNINDPETCLYTSDLNYSVGVVDRIAVRDNARNYRIPLLIRYPIGATGPRPVVIWNHGGTPAANGRKRSAEWGNTLAAAGYVVIHPARVLISNPAPFQAECTANGYDTPSECAYWVTQFRYGPQNTHFLINHFPLIESKDPALAGMLDHDKIVVAGHSAGSRTVLANAGAWQQWVNGGTIYNERDNRPIAFLASGPAGPMYAGYEGGFQSASFETIDRPFMFITGMGDSTGEPSEARVTGWLRSVPGNKVLSWDNKSQAKHETMDIHLCDTPLRANHCRWIASAGLAFLDAIVRQRTEAQDWLKSDAYSVLTGGAIELHFR